MSSICSAITNTIKIQNYFNDHKSSKIGTPCDSLHGLDPHLTSNRAPDCVNRRAASVDDLPVVVVVVVVVVVDAEDVVGADLGSEQGEQALHTDVGAALRVVTDEHEVEEAVRKVREDVEARSPAEGAQTAGEHHRVVQHRV